jgi:hypothetical protein
VPEPALSILPPYARHLLVERLVWLWFAREEVAEVTAQEHHSWGEACASQHAFPKVPTMVDPIPKVSTRVAMYEYPNQLGFSKVPAMVETISKSGSLKLMIGCTRKIGQARFCLV